MVLSLGQMKYCFGAMKEKFHPISGRPHCGTIVPRAREKSELESLRPFWKSRGQTKSNPLVAVATAWQVANCRHLRRRGPGSGQASLQRGGVGGNASTTQVDRF